MNRVYYSQNYEKYTSRNPLLKILVRKFQYDMYFFIEKLCLRTILDAGCGEGFTIKRLKEKNANLKLIGVDYSEDALNMAKLIASNSHYCAANMYGMPFKKESFDLIISTEVLEHLEYPEIALEELKRVSRKYVIISVPNEPFFRIANILRLKYLSRLGNTPDHIQNWTKSQLRLLLSKHFREVKIKTSTFWNIALCTK